MSVYHLIFWWHNFQFTVILQCTFVIFVFFNIKGINWELTFPRGYNNFNIAYCANKYLNNQIFVSIKNCEGYFYGISISSHAVTEVFLSKFFIGFFSVQISGSLQATKVLTKLNDDLLLYTWRIWTYSKLRNFSSYLIIILSPQIRLQTCLGD